MSNISGKSEAIRFAELELGNRCKSELITIITLDHKNGMLLPKGDAINKVNRVIRTAYAWNRERMPEKYRIGFSFTGRKGRINRAIVVRDFVEALREMGYKDVSYPMQAFDTFGIEEEVDNATS